MVWVAAAGVAHADATDDFIRGQMKAQNIPVSVIVLMNIDDADDDTVASGVADLYLPDRR